MWKGQNSKTKSPVTAIREQLRKILPQYWMVSQANLLVIEPQLRKFRTELVNQKIWTEMFLYRQAPILIFSDITEMN